MKHLILAGAVAVGAMMFVCPVGTMSTTFAATPPVCNDKECNLATGKCYSFINTPRHRCQGQVTYGWSGGVWTIISRSCRGYIC